jgi:uncharacterized membrane protein
MKILKDLLSYGTNILIYQLFHTAYTLVVQILACQVRQQQKLIKLILRLIIIQIIILKIKKMKNLKTFNIFNK